LNAPGPSELLIAREKRARIALKKAQSEPWGSNQTKAQQAEKELAEVEGLLQRDYADLDRYPVPGFLDASYGTGAINLAVTGGSGVGKSSFINALRRLSARDPAAARTGFNETTFEPEKFTFSPGRTGVFRKAFDGVTRILQAAGLSDSEELENPIRNGDRLMLQGLAGDLDGQSAEVVDAGRWSHDDIRVRLDDGREIKVDPSNVVSVLADCVLWDLPGVGTSSFPQATYLARMGIRHFDLVVLLTATRFTEAELMLMEELRRWKVPYFLARSKIDADIEAEIEDEEEDCHIGDPDAQGIEERVVTSVKEFFSRSYGQAEIYCISARPKHRRRFDFLRLEADMQDAIRAQRVVETQELNPLIRLLMS